MSHGYPAPSGGERVFLAQTVGDGRLHSGVLRYQSSAHAGSGAPGPGTVGRRGGSRPRAKASKKASSRSCIAPFCEKRDPSSVAIGHQIGGTALDQEQQRVGPSGRHAPASADSRSSNPPNSSSPEGVPLRHQALSRLAVEAGHRDGRGSVGRRCPRSRGPSSRPHGAARRLLRSRRSSRRASPPRRSRRLGRLVDHQAPCAGP